MHRDRDKEVVPQPCPPPAILRHSPVQPPAGGDESSTEMAQLRVPTVQCSQVQW